MSKVGRSGSVRLQSNITRANSGKEGRQLLDAIADVHYYISIPEERPLHSTFDKGAKIGLFLKEDTGRIRIRFVDSTNPKGSALSGDISVLRLEFDNNQECFVRAEIDYGEDYGVSLGSDWTVSAPDENNDGMHDWRPFCVDIYFWKHSMADFFVRLVDEYQKRLQVQSKAEEAKRKASLSEAAHSPSNSIPMPIANTNGEAKPRTPEPKIDTRNVEDEDEEEMFKKNITSVDCLDCNNGEIFPVAGSVMECRVIKNQTKKTTRILISSPIEGGHLRLCYTLTDRSFPYQLPESTVQVRFMLVEKTLTINPGANVETIQNAAPLDSPIFQFEQDEHAQIFMECLRGEQLLLNSIVDWVRSTRESKEAEASGIANFTCVDDRRIQLWENELGFINVVFHRQFHLVSAFIAPTTQVEAEAGASTLKLSGIKIRKLERSPNMDSKEPWKSDGTPAVLKLRFAGPDNVAAFRDAVLRHRDATAMLFPEVSKSISKPPAPKPVAQEQPLENKVPPPPPPEFRHGRSMSSSAAVPPPPGPPPNSPPQQFPASPQSPGPHQTSFQQYNLSHSQSVRMNRPPPLPMFSNQGQGGYVPASMHSPRFQNGAQPSPMTGTFAPAGLGQFFASPPGAPPAAAPYQSPAVVANVTIPPLSPMPNQGYFPASITPMTPGLPTGKFPPPLQTSLPQPPGPQPPQTPIREHMRKNSFPPENSIQMEPVELPASFPDDPEPKSAEVKEQPTSRKFTKADDIPEEEPIGYNPLGGNVSIGVIPAPNSRQQASAEGGKMSRVWKKLK